MFKNFENIVKLVSTVSVFVIVISLVVMGFFFPDNFGQLLVAISTFITDITVGMVKMTPFFNEFELKPVVKFVAWTLAILFATTILFHIINHLLVNTIKQYRSLKNKNDKKNDDTNEVKK